jgi:SAM-dependent methyltransferase
MKEEDIRPAGLLETFLSLAQADIPRFFPQSGRATIVCPACGGAPVSAFAKNGFQYDECPVCLTLFVNPRPSAEAFFDYYRKSESCKFWATTFYKATAEARRETLWKPKCLPVRNALAALGYDNATVIDIGGGYGIFAEEYRRLTGREVVVIEPAPDLAAACRGRNLHVVEQFLESVTFAQLPAGRKAFVSFELFEHLHDPEVFCAKLFRLMAPDDIFLFTTLSGMGLDIRVLWENSKAVSPPHHLNFFNPRSIKILLERVGFRVLQVSTPGKLDVDILRNNKSMVHDRFWKTFLEEASEGDVADMQQAVAAAGFSSHMMTICTCQ